MYQYPCWCMGMATIEKKKSVSVDWRRKWAFEEGLLAESLCVFPSPRSKPLPLLKSNFARHAVVLWDNLILCLNTLCNVYIKTQHDNWSWLAITLKISFANSEVVGFMLNNPGASSTVINIIYEHVVDKIILKIYEKSNMDVHGQNWPF